ncbi:MAG: LacI family DNA-binding transcriptional regulator [Armatimonadota bacterium]
MTTVRQLAKLAGVSPTTVSLALHNHPSISAATRQRIQELAATYQFRPRWTPSRYAGGNFGMIGCLVPGLHAGFYSEVLRGILTAAFAESYHVITLESLGDPSHCCLALETFMDQRVDGVLMSSGHLEKIRSDILLKLASAGIPVVCISYTPTERALDHVFVDEDRMAHLAIDYLFDLGHRQIAYVGPPLRNPRERAFEQAARRFGLSLDIIEHAANLPSTENNAPLPITFGHPSSPTAVIGYADFYAALAIRDISQRGLRVPSDVSVLGCGNHRYGRLTCPTLTSIELFPEEIGRRALTLLLQRMEALKNGEPYEPQTVLLDPQLVVRQSCAPPRHSPRRHAGGISDTPPVSPPVNHGVTGAVARLLPCCDPPRGKSELMTLLGLRDVNHFRHAYIDQALQRGLIARTLPDKPNSSKQQYRVTEQGRRWLRERGTTGDRS